MQLKQPESEKGLHTLKAELTAWEANDNEKKQEEMNREKSVMKTTLGLFAGLAVGGYFAWQNRFRIQRFLEANGISTLWMKGSVGEAVKSGAAKLTGAVEHGSKSLSDAHVLHDSKVAS